MLGGLKGRNLFSHSFDTLKSATVQTGSTLPKAVCLKVGFQPVHAEEVTPNRRELYGCRGALMGSLLSLFPGHQVGVFSCTTCVFRDVLGCCKHKVTRPKDQRLKLLDVADEITCPLFRLMN